MREMLEQVVAAARGIWRYRWQAMAAVWAILVVGLVALHVLLVPTFTARAQVYVDTETVLRPLLKGLALEVNPSEQLGLMARQLMSRPNLEQVVRETGLDRQGKDPQPIGVVMERLRKNISLKAERTSSEARYINFYVISYANPDAHQAKQVVESLIGAFAQNTLAEIRRDAERAKRFLDQQIDEHRARVDAAERRLREYKRVNVDLLPQEGQGYFQHLQTEQAALADVELEIKQTESRKRELRAQLAATPAVTRAVTEDGKPVLTPIESRLEALHAKLDQLLLKYTEAHPRVTETRASIAQLERQQQQAPGETPTMANPIHQQLEIRLKEVEGDLAGLHTRREDYARRVQALQQQIETLPAVEDELQRLTQDFKSATDSLQTLLARRQSMEMSESVGHNSEELKFRVIEPPNVPVDSTLNDAWRKQIKFMTAVLVVAIGGGIALAYLLAQIRPTIYSQRALSEFTDLPVYGVISRVDTPSWRMKRSLEMTGYGITVFLVLVAYGVALLVQFESTYGGTGTSVVQHFAKFFGGGS